HEGIPILDCLVPKAFVHAGGKLTGVRFEKVKAVRDERGRRQLVPTGEPEQLFECDEVLVAVGPKNIIWAVAQGHDAAISIDKFLHGEDVSARPAPGVTLVSQKMGIHEWSYENEVAPDTRYKVLWRDVNQVLKNIK